MVDADSLTPSKLAVGAFVARNVEVREPSASRDLFVERQPALMVDVRVKRDVRVKAVRQFDGTANLAIIWPECDSRSSWRRRLSRI